MELFCAVTSNSWLDATYGKNLKEFLLKHCWNKFVLDNSVKRSFKDVDVNTVICLTSAPNSQYESNLRKITRFVTINVPFEMILDPVIFYEIETAFENINTKEHNIRPFPQEVILMNGMNEKTTYKGEKWGAKYLRSPDIYLHILENNKNVLVCLDDIASIQRGIMTGADYFFAPEETTISKWNIEREYLSPVITDSADVKSLVVYRDQLNRLPNRIFRCFKDKVDLEGTSALDYIEWGESQNIHQRVNCRRRKIWYSLSKRVPPTLCFPLLTPSTTSKTLYAPDGCYVIGNYIEVDLERELRIPTSFSLNSTFFQLVVNVNGRLNRTWTLEIQANDLKGLQCVNPNIILNAASLDVKKLKSQDWDVLEPSEARKYIDNIVFDILELSQGERDGVYEALTKLVTKRLEKAKT